MYDSDHALEQWRSRSVYASKPAVYFFVSQQLTCVSDGSDSILGYVTKSMVLRGLRYILRVGEGSFAFPPRRHAPRQYAGEIWGLALVAQAKAGAVNEDELVDRLLSEALETLKQVTAAVGELNRELETIERRIENGELRREAEAEMRQWLAENPEALLLFRRNALSSFDF